jgi:hypothetical protein
MRSLAIEMTDQIPAREQQLLQSAADWIGPRQLKELDDQLLCELVRVKGIDFATAVLYDQLCRRTDVAELLSRFRQQKNRKNAVSTVGHVAIVPGALYREYPQTGADGRTILAEVQRLGWSAELVPVPSAASPHENGEYLCEWLNRQQLDDLVLVSLSKGGADVKCAMLLPGAAEAFSRVSGWVNFGGILDGAPMVEWACTRWITRSWYRGVCKVGGYDFNAFESLRRNDMSPLSFPLQIFHHIKTIHVVGVPLRRHLSSRRAKRWHRRLARWGPNDSVTLLTDVLRWPGKVFPVWGTDHYWQERWDARRLVPFLLQAASNFFATSDCLT